MRRGCPGLTPAHHWSIKLRLITVKWLSRIYIVNTRALRTFLAVHSEYTIAVFKMAVVHKRGSLPTHRIVIFYTVMLSRRVFQYRRRCRLTVARGGAESSPRVK